MGFALPLPVGPAAGDGAGGFGGVRWVAGGDDGGLLVVAATGRTTGVGVGVMVLGSGWIAGAAASLGSPDFGDAAGAGGAVVATGGTVLDPIEIAPSSARAAPPARVAANVPMPATSAAATAAAIVHASPPFFPRRLRGVMFAALLVDRLSPASARGRSSRSDCVSSSSVTSMADRSASASSAQVACRS